MSNQKQAGGGPLGKIKIGNAIYPILIGLAVVGWMLWRDFNPEVFADIRFSSDGSVSRCFSCSGVISATSSASGC